MNALVERFAAERRWVLWRSERVGDRLTKVPYNPRGRKASATDPATWATLPEVARATGFSGIGIVVAHPLLAVDLDDVLHDGRVTDCAALEFIGRADSYTEISPSGAGLHVYLLLTEPLRLKRNRSGHYEVYTNARFMTVTGASWHEVARPLRTVTPAEAEALLSVLGYPWQAEPTGGEGARPAAPAPTATASDDELLARILASQQAAKARALLAGDATGYRSQSEADQALCCLLAWWTRDPAQIERIWLSSGAGQRAKVREREDYRKRTIRFALERVAPRTHETQKREVSLRAKLRRAARRGATWTR